MIRRPPRSTLLSLHDALPILIEVPRGALTADEIAQTAEFFSFGTNDLTQTCLGMSREDRKSTRLNSSHSQISYAVFCLKKKKNTTVVRPPAETLRLAYLCYLV